MVDRFEYELDTTSPHEEWMKEVEENIGAKREAGKRLMAVRPDNRLADSPMVPVAAAAAVRLLARKSTWDQTSVQWNAEASARCLERRDAEHLAAHPAAGCSWPVRR